MESNRAENQYAEYAARELSRAEVDAMTGPVVLDFGTSWCGYCRSAKPLVDNSLAAHPALRHMRIEDGKGRPLGRSFRVTLWPTLIFLRDGKEYARLVRPDNIDAINEALKAIDPGG